MAGTPTTTSGYYILQGVRRCVAAREAGKTDILADINEPGKPDVRTRIPLTQLYSRKPYVLRDYRYIRDTEYPTLVLKTEPPPIIVEPLGLRGQDPNPTPILQVALK
jgi:hypothetical protein